MRAALVEDFRFPPRYRETSPPVADDGEIVLRVRAAALSNLLRGQADWIHHREHDQLACPTAPQLRR